MEERHWGSEVRGVIVKRGEWGRDVCGTDSDIARVTGVLTAKQRPWESDGGGMIVEH